MTGYECVFRQTSGGDARKPTNAAAWPERGGRLAPVSVTQRPRAGQ